MAVRRRRWTSDELDKARWLAARLDSLSDAELRASGASAVHLDQRLQAIQARLGSHHQSRIPLPEAFSAADLRALTAASGCEHGVLRDRESRLLLVRGGPKWVTLDPSDTVLVHSHTHDLPPSGKPGSGSGGGDYQWAVLRHSAPGLAIVGPDGSVTDYDAQGLSPDTEFSYVADDGPIDGRLHRVSLKPPKAWQPRNPGLGAEQSPPLQDRGALLPVLWRLIEAGAVTLIHGLRLAARRLRGPITGEERGRRLAGLLQALGPTATKVGQFLSLRPDLVGLEVAKQLARLQDGLACRAPNNIERLLSQQFGEAFESRFASVDSLPFSTASIAHVYRARLNSGEEVAVKVIRQGVARTMRRDLWILQRCALWIERLPRMKLIPLGLIAGEVSSALRQQLDLAREARSCQRMRRNLQHLEGVTIPRVFADCSSPHALTMSLVKDRSPIDADGLSKRTRARVGLLALRALYQMIFRDGLVHADLHPGNIWILPGDAIGLLDFGLVAELSDLDRDDFRRFFLAMATNDGSECARIMYETASWRSPAFDRATYQAAVVELVARYSGKVAKDFSVSGFAAELFEVQRKCGLRSSTAFIMVIVSLAGFEGLARRLDPSLDFQKEARRFLAQGRLRGVSDFPAQQRQAFRAITGVRGAAVWGR